jgi:hypothetical protein
MNWPPLCCKDSAMLLGMTKVELFRASPTTSLPRRSQDAPYLLRSILPCIFSMILLVSLPSSLPFG